MHGLLEAVDHYTFEVGLRIKKSKADVMPAHILKERRQAVPLDDELVGEPDNVEARTELNG